MPGRAYAAARRAAVNIAQMIHYRLHYIMLIAVPAVAPLGMALTYQRAYCDDAPFVSSSTRAGIFGQLYTTPRRRACCAAYYNRRLMLTSSSSLAATRRSAATRNDVVCRRECFCRQAASCRQSPRAEKSSRASNIIKRRNDIIGAAMRLTVDASSGHEPGDDYLCSRQRRRRRMKIVFALLCPAVIRIYDAASTEGD